MAVSQVHHRLDPSAHIFLLHRIESLIAKTNQVSQFLYLEKKEIRGHLEQFPLTPTRVNRLSLPRNY